MGARERRAQDGRNPEPVRLFPYTEGVDHYDESSEDAETQKEPARLVAERVREISDWLPRGADMRTALAMVDGAVVVRLARAA